jgi:hypothetical protein
MTFTVASWNVEFFGSRRPGEAKGQVRQRIEAGFDYLAGEVDSDVYAIYEVNGGQVFHAVKAALPGYSSQITKGSGVQQILVGFRVPAFVTQRLEFSRGFAGPLRRRAVVPTRQGPVAAQGPRGGRSAPARAVHRGRRPQHPRHDAHLLLARHHDCTVEGTHD